MNLKIKHIILALVGLVLLSAIFVVPVKVENQASAKELAFGFPLAFVQQDFSEDYSENSIYPWYQRFEIKRPITEFSAVKFIASFAVFFVGLELLIFVLEQFKWRLLVFLEKRRENKNPSFP